MTACVVPAIAFHSLWMVSPTPPCFTGRLPYLTIDVKRNTFYSESMTIRSFRCEDTEALYEGLHPKRFRNIEAVAERKLQMLDVAEELKDLRSPPGNRLEALSGNRAGQHSIRINDQWRVCFVWTATGPESVEIVDYH